MLWVTHLANNNLESITYANFFERVKWKNLLMVTRILIENIQNIYKKFSLVRPKSGWRKSKQCLLQSFLLNKQT